MQLKHTHTYCSLFVQDNTFPADLYGYWILNDDLTFFGNFGNFKGITTPGVCISSFELLFF